jgi:hypothetical protein
MKVSILSSSLIILLIAINNLVAQTTTQKYKSYLNTGVGIYLPFNATTKVDDSGYSGTLNLETEITKKSIARLSIDNYRIPLVKTILFNNTVIESNTKTNITYLGLDYGINLTKKQFRFYTLIGASICFIDEPEFKTTANQSISVVSQNTNRFGLRVSSGVKYHLKETWIFFVEIQNLTLFYKNQSEKNQLNGGGVIIGIATVI